MTTKELSYYKMTQAELDIWNKFCDDVKLNCSQIGIYNTDIIEYNLQPSIYYQCSRGYHSDIGFYEIIFGDRAELFENIRTQNISDCMWHYLLKIACKVASNMEMTNRGEKQASWKYTINYDGRLFKFSNTINFLNKIYNTTEYLEDYIKYCTDLMNLEFEYEHWKYDKISQEFVENKNDMV